MDEISLLNEKREDFRVPLEVEVEIQAFHRDIKMMGWVNDISHGGFKLTANTPDNFKGIFQQGDAISFETFEDFYSLKGNGRIAWISPDGETLGVRFDQLPDESRVSLHQFLVCFNHLNNFPQGLSTLQSSPLLS